MMADTVEFVVDKEAVDLWFNLLPPSVLIRGHNQTIMDELFLMSSMVA